MNHTPPPSANIVSASNTYGIFLFAFHFHFFECMPCIFCKEFVCECFAFFGKKFVDQSTINVQQQENLRWAFFLCLSNGNLWIRKFTCTWYLHFPPGPFWRNLLHFSCFRRTLNHLHCGLLSSDGQWHPPGWRGGAVPVPQEQHHPAEFQLRGAGRLR